MGLRSMQSIGSYEAKTRLPELLRQVAQGEEFTITRRGVPVARIVGVEDSVEDLRAIIERMKAARAQRPSIPVRELLDARDRGRKP